MFKKDMFILEKSLFFVITKMDLSKIEEGWLDMGTGLIYPEEKLMKQIKKTE